MFFKKVCKGTAFFAYMQVFEHFLIGKVKLCDYRQPCDHADSVRLVSPCNDTDSECYSSKITGIKDFVRLLCSVVNDFACFGAILFLPKDGVAAFVEFATHLLEGDVKVYFCHKNALLMYIIYKYII